jgi:hypothetical protein
MDKIKKWKEFERLYEFTEFNLQRMNPDKGGVMPNVDNPQLSINAYDRHQSAILAASSKLNSIMATLSNSAALANLKSRLFLDEQKLNALKVLRIFKNDNVRYDVYLEFVLGDKAYHGMIKDLLGVAPKMTSEAFSDTELVLTREWIIKTRGLILKAIQRWLEPEPGIYTSLKDDIDAYNMKTGGLSKISTGTDIEVRTTADNKIIVKHENDFYSLQNDSFVYFNYWFEKNEKLGSPDSF